jgi:hypothetical protein
MSDPKTKPVDHDARRSHEPADSDQYARGEPVVEPVYKECPGCRESPHRHFHHDDYGLIWLHPGERSRTVAEPSREQSAETEARVAALESDKELLFHQFELARDNHRKAEKESSDLRAALREADNLLTSIISRLDGPDEAIFTPGLDAAIRKHLTEALLAGANPAKEVSLEIAEGIFRQLDSTWSTWSASGRTALIDAVLLPLVGRVQALEREAMTDPATKLLALIAEGEKIAEGATNGPWAIGHPGRTGGIVQADASLDWEWVVMPHEAQDCEGNANDAGRAEDWAFIAHARTALPAAYAALRVLAEVGHDLMAGACMGALLGEDCGWCPTCRQGAALARALEALRPGEK